MRQARDRAQLPCHERADRQPGVADIQYNQIDFHGWSICGSPRWRRGATASGITAHLSSAGVRARPRRSAVRAAQCFHQVLLAGAPVGPGRQALEVRRSSRQALTRRQITRSSSVATAVRPHSPNVCYRARRHSAVPRSPPSILLKWSKRASTIRPRRRGNNGFSPSTFGARTRTGRHRPAPAGTVRT